MAKPVKVGLLGCGQISRTHLKALTNQSDAQVTALCDVDPETAAERARQFGLDAPRFDDFETFLKRGDMDAVAICTPVEAHVEQALACLGARKHVLCEKPMGQSAAEAQRVADAAAADGLVYMLDHRFLFDPLLGQAAALAMAPAFGRAHRMHLWIGNVTDPKDRPGIYQAGGGCLGDMAYHGIYYALRILGMPRRIYTTAKTLKYDTTLDDNCALLLEYDHALASLEFSFTQLASGVPGGRPMMIFGERQSLYADLIANTLWLHGDGEPVTPASEPWTGPMYRHFCQCIRGEAQNIAGMDDGLAAMRVLDAARTSAADGKAVTL